MDERDLDIVDRFILPERQERYRALISSGKRNKAIGRLSSSTDVNMKFARTISAQDESRLTDLLKSLGALPTCYVMSQLSKIDGREMPLADALDAVMYTDSGSILLCNPGRLGYYEGELGERYILIRNPKKN